MQNSIDFAALYQDHQNLVGRISYRILRNSEDTKESMQDTFLKAFCAFNTYDQSLPFAKWIGRIAYTTAVNKLRKRHDDYQYCHNYKHWHQRWNIDDLIDMKIALEKLLPIHKQVLELQYFQGLSLTEIAELIKVPRNTVKTRIHYAKNWLRKRLDVH